jgi:hypothetical protein
VCVARRVDGRRRVAVAVAGVRIRNHRVGVRGRGAARVRQRSDGSSHLGATLLLLPYLMPYRALWWALRARADRQPYVELIAGSLFVGRRLRAHEFPSGLACVVDLTCEFESEARHARPAIARYISLPILDAYVPAADVLVDIVRRINAVEGPVYLHCAEGRGRMALVACAVLLSRGLADDVDGAVALLRAKRLIMLSGAQRALLVRAQAALLALQR